MGTYEEILETFKKKLKTVSVVEIADIPKIDLYMDQVTTFMDQALTPYKRSSDGKVLTKTMINNYTKAKVLPPPSEKEIWTHAHHAADYDFSSENCFIHKRYCHFIPADLCPSYKGRV